MNSKTKTTIYTLGTLSGLIFSLYDSFVAYCSTAPFDESIATSIKNTIQTDLLSTKTLVYSLIGFITSTAFIHLFTFAYNRMKKDNR